MSYEKENDELGGGKQPYIQCSCEVCCYYKSICSPKGCCETCESSVNGESFTEGICQSAS